MAKYLDLISKNSKEAEQEQLKFRAEEAKLQVASAILETKKQITTKKRLLEEAKSAIPYDLQKEVDLTIEVQNLEAGLKIAQGIEKERF